jgi:hypothetical protein
LRPILLQPPAIDLAYGVRKLFMANEFENATDSTTDCQLFPVVSSIFGTVIRVIFPYIEILGMPHK